MVATSVSYASLKDSEYPQQSLVCIQVLLCVKSVWESSEVVVDGREGRPRHSEEGTAQVKHGLLEKAGEEANTT